MDGSEKKEGVWDQVRIWHNGTVRSADEECWYSSSKQLKLVHLTVCSFIHDCYSFQFYCIRIAIDDTHEKRSGQKKNNCGITNVFRKREERLSFGTDEWTAWCSSMGGDPSRPTLRTEHCLRYESLDSLKADGMGREKINKYPTRRPFAGCLCNICMHYAVFLTK